MFKHIYRAADDMWSYMWKTRPNTKRVRPRNATI